LARISKTEIEKVARGLAAAGLELPSLASISATSGSKFAEIEAKLGNL